MSPADISEAKECSEAVVVVTSRHERRLDVESDHLWCSVGRKLTPSTSQFSFSRQSPSSTRRR